MAQFRIIRRQRPIKGGREPLPACVLKDIRHAVEAEAMRHGVSKSFVIAVVLAKAFGIDEQEPFDIRKRPHAPVPPPRTLPTTTGKAATRH